MKKAAEFSKNQQTNAVGVQKCKVCIDAKSNGTVVGVEGPLAALAAPTGSSGVDGVDELTSKLSAANLDAHNKSAKGKAQPIELERRQFCCGNHPQPLVFFRKVAKYKPVAKCPECKKGNYSAPRLVAVPKSQEKGFGRFRCDKCPEKWSSSRACATVGMYCANISCQNHIDDVPVYPFRIEPWKKGGFKSASEKRKEAAARGAVSSMPIGEDDQEEHGYAGNGGGSGGFAGGGGGGGFAGGGGGGQRNDFNHEKDYDFLEKPYQPDAPAPAAEAWGDKDKDRPKMVHRCTGCATGLCNNKRVPISALHVSTGSTNSSSGRTAKTFSTVDDSEYEDRDWDFV
jgi:uncharacterized membrane protein YgcG